VNSVSNNSDRWLLIPRSNQSSALVLYRLAPTRSNRSQVIIMNRNISARNLLRTKTSFVVYVEVSLQRCRKGLPDKQRIKRSEMSIVENVHKKEARDRHQL
jgi:hypothetical protein